MKVLSPIVSAALTQSAFCAAQQGYTNVSEVPLYGLSLPVYPSRKFAGILFKRMS